MDLKGTYVSAARSVRRGAESLGVMEGWDRRATTSRAWCWSRSLLAVYDFEDLVRLDVPWWTFDAADRVEAFLRGRRDARVFEWGSGASTMWLASRAGSVTAVEHDAEWAHMVGDRVPANARVVLVPPAPVAGKSAPILSEKAGFEGLDFADYVKQIDKEDGPFDLIVVDGRARGACLRRALDHLAPGGMIVFDNVDRERYRRAIAAEGARIRVDWTRGLTPCLPYPTRTALITVAES